MILIPAIEIRGGAVVAAVPSGGAEAEVLSDDPLAIARGLRDEGALFFHVVDLDAVAGGARQIGVVQALVDAGLPCEVSGGIADAAAVEELVAAGADRIVVDTALLADEKGARELIERLGARIAVGLDVDGDRVRTIGRRTEATVPLDEALAMLVELGVKRVVHRDATATEGPNADGVRAVLGRVEAEVFAAAVVRSKADLESLTTLAGAGLAGIVLEDAARAMLARAQG